MGVWFTIEMERNIISEQFIKIKFINLGRSKSSQNITSLMNLSIKIVWIPYSPED